MAAFKDIRERDRWSLRALNEKLVRVANRLNDAVDIIDNINDEKTRNALSSVEDALSFVNKAIVLNEKKIAELDYELNKKGEEK